MGVEERIKEIIEDRRSGSSKLIKKTLELLEDVEPQRRLEICRKIVKAHPAMAGLTKVLNAVENGADVHDIRNIFAEMDRNTSEHLREIAKGKIVATISRSHIVEKGLTTAKHVIVLESSPAREGIDTARYLKGRVVEVSIFPDPAIGYAVKLSDIVVVGADALYSDGFVNKTGTLPLALSAKYLSKPFYVAAPSYKFSEGKFEEPKSLNFTKNMIFEFIPAELVTEFIWENGKGSLEEIKSQEF